MALINQFFTQNSVTFAGEYYRVTDLAAAPKPSQRPHPPIFIGGGGKKTLTLAAREADIAGLERRLKDGAGSSDAYEHGEAALAEKVAFLREAAGERFPAIELNHGIAHLIVTEHRQQVAEQRARERAATGGEGLRRPLSAHRHCGVHRGNAATTARAVWHLLSARFLG